MIRGVQAGAFAEQKFHSCPVASSNRGVQQGAALVVADVDVGAVREQFLRNFKALLLDRVMQGSLAAGVVRLIRQGAIGLQQGAHFGAVTEEDGGLNFTAERNAACAGQPKGKQTCLARNAVEKPKTKPRQPNRLENALIFRAHGLRLDLSRFGWRAELHLAIGGD